MLHRVLQQELVRSLATTTQTKQRERDAMFKSNHHAIRMLLKQAEDGLTISEIAERTEIHRGSINRVLTQMPDAYIDRWTESKKQWAAVWCVIVPPQNCPKPN